MGTDNYCDMPNGGPCSCGVWHPPVAASVEKPVFTVDDLERLLARVSVGNSVIDWKWKFRHRPFMAFGGDGREIHGWLLWVEFERPDTHSGKAGVGRGRDEVVFRGAYESSVIKTAWVLIEMNVRHELMEAFKVDGVRIFDPHRTVAQLKQPG